MNHHDVDEGMMTIAGYGGDWACRDMAGIALRCLADSPTTFDTVASRLIYLS